MQCMQKGKKVTLREKNMNNIIRKNYVCKILSLEKPSCYEHYFPLGINGIFISSRLSNVNECIFPSFGIVILFACSILFLMITVVV